MHARLEFERKAIAKNSRWCVWLCDSTAYGIVDRRPTTAEAVRNQRWYLISGTSYPVNRVQ